MNHPHPYDVLISVTRRHIAWAEKERNACIVLSFTNAVSNGFTLYYFSLSILTIIMATIFGVATIIFAACAAANHLEILTQRANLHRLEDSSNAHR